MKIRLYTPSGMMREPVDGTIGTVASAASCVEGGVTLVVRCEDANGGDTRLCSARMTPQQARDLAKRLIDDAQWSETH